MSKKSLQLEQLNAKMNRFEPVKLISVPGTGWVKAIRTAIGMSLTQMGNRLGITKQSAQEIEVREKEGTITLNALKEVALALDMQLVYGFVPVNGTLDDLINRKAKELATRIILRTSASMVLEDQGNSEERLQKAIENRADEIKREMPKMLWD